jgi:hypothetical protein
MLVSQAVELISGQEALIVVLTTDHRKPMGRPVAYNAVMYWWRPHTIYHSGNGLLFVKGAKDAEGMGSSRRTTFIAMPPCG